MTFQEIMQEVSNKTGVGNVVNVTISYDGNQYSVYINGVFNAYYNKTD